jgi:hypothetical protein
MTDGDKLAAWLREAAYEIQNAHAGLDNANIPRTAEDGASYTLAARIALLRRFTHDIHTP